MKRLIIYTSLLALLVALLAFPASAAVFDPYENGTVSVDGDLELVTVRLDTSKMFWQRFHDGSASVNSTGSTLTYSTQMRYVDNDQVTCWPFGLLNRVETAGIPTGSQISYDFTVGVNITNASQTFDCIAQLYLDTYDANGNVISSTLLESDYSNGITTGAHFIFDQYFDTSLLAGSASWLLRFMFDFNGVANESDTTSVTLTSFGDNISVVIPYSQLYQLQQQGDKTNKLLGDIDSQLQANGERLDDVIAAQQNTQNKLDEMATRPVTPVAPDGAGEVDDFHDKESGLVGDAFADFERDDTIGDAIAGLRERATAFLAVTWIFNLLSRDVFFADLLYISLAVGMFAAFLNIIIHSGHSGKEKATKHRDTNPQKRIGGK